MQKITLLPALLAVLLIGSFSACNKSNSGASASYHLTATIDGKAETFNVNDIATRTTLGGVTYIAITGFATSSPTGETMSLSLSNGFSRVAFKPGTYSDTASSCDIAGIYQASLSSQFLAGTSVTQSSLLSSVSIANHFKVAITSIDSASMKGTFSGDYFAGGDPTGAKKTITSGDFYVKFH